MKIVIAEKPSVARELAKVLEATTKRDGYIEGKEYLFTWAFGHLIGLAQPETYGYKEWLAATLPMLPDSFQLLPNGKYNANTKVYEPDPGVLKQLRIIEKLFKNCSEIIVATDAGREGELIFRYIYEYLQCTKPFKRLWISSQTDKAIIEGFKNVEEGKKYDRLYDAAKARSEADWLVGMNATRALTIASGIKGVFSIGRVQTPTLAIICERYLSHQDFVPTIYFKVLLSFSKDNIAFRAVSEKNYTTKEEALQAENEAKKIQYGHVVEMDIKDKKESPPLLYDLTALQREANKKYGLSANKTLEIAQDLYERKFITYPRTGSRYIGEDVFEKIDALIMQFEQHILFGSAASYLKGKKLNKKSVNDSKVTDHHALLPTENIAVGLTGDELNIYNLIVYRLLEAFHEDCLKKQVQVTINAGANYIISGSKIMYAGWRMVRIEQQQEEEKTEDDEDLKLPELKKDEPLRIIQFAVEEKQTKSKPIHTEASLLGAMETCGKEIEDEQLKEAIKDTGLGTPATRAAIIETLFARNYIERQKKNIIPTKKGIALYHLVKNKSIAKPILTGEWEKRLAEIQKGVLSTDIFNTYIREYTKEITSELLSVDTAFKATIEKIDAATDNDIGICPKCKTGSIKASEKNYYCSSYKTGCDFKIWKLIAGKKITELQAKELIEKGKTALIKGFKNKEGKEFMAVLKLVENEVRFDFPDKK